MITSTLDILYVVLAIGLGMLLIALTVLIIRCIGTVKRANRIMEIFEDSAETVNEYIQVPANVASTVKDWIKHADFFKYYDWIKGRMQKKEAPEEPKEEAPAASKSRKKKRRRR